MCIDGNTADLSVHYINAQLVALWENAQKCATHAAGLDFKSAAYEKSKATRALREYHYLTRKAKHGLQEKELFFSAKFDRPQLKFICNHSAFFYLKIESGHLNLEVKEADRAGAKAKQSANRNIKSLEVVFHVPITRTSTKGRDSKISNGSADHTIQMQILKLDDAKLIMVNPDSTLGSDVRDALAFYMRHYLAFLKASGKHVFFDLCDFDATEGTTKSDFSCIRTREIDGLLKNVQQEVKLLNKFDCGVLSQFYRAKFLVASALSNSGKWGSLDTALASVCSEWIIGYQVQHHFFINFEAPTIQVLCPHEVILKFRVKDLAFFKETHIDAKATVLKEFHDWTIAFVVRVFENDSGMIQLDFETAQFSRIDSFFGAKVDTEIEKYMRLMIGFFSVDYVDILISHSLHLCVESSGGFALGSGEHHSADWTSGSEDEEPVGFYRQRGFAMLWMERIERMQIHSGFDQVITLSETAINRILGERLKVVSLFEGSAGAFRLDVHGLKVRLLSNGKAILYVQAEGHMRVKKRTASTWKFWIPYIWELASETDECEQCSFESITLAYEVDLKLVSHECVQGQVDKSVVEYILEKTGFSSTSVKVTTEVTHSHAHGLKHFILDLSNARFIEKLSDVGALECGETSSDRMKTIQTYVPRYFESLVTFGHNILHTVTMAGAARDSSLFAFTDVDFKVLTKRRVAASVSLFERETVEAPIVMIYGMCTGAPMPALIDAWGLGWLTVGKRSVGTLALSRRVFLERCILRHLEGINARTTLVPKSVDVVDGKWHVALITWDKRDKQSVAGCKWTQIASKEPGHIAYQWYHKDEWKHKHESDKRDTNNGEYALDCTTQNSVCIPTAYNASGMVIKVEGSSSLRVHGKTNDEKWKNKTTFSWSATLALDTSSGSLKVNFSHVQPTLTHDRGECVGRCPFDLAELHKKCFMLDVKMFDTFVPVLKSAFENNWSYCTMGIQQVTIRDPIFTRKGDFVCELDLVTDRKLPHMFNRDLWKKNAEWHCEYKPGPTIPLVNGKPITVSTSFSGSFSSGYVSGNGTPALSPSLSTATALSSAAVTPALEVKPDILIPAPKAAAPMTTKVTKNGVHNEKNGAFLQEKL
ncbi:hypothetical protein PsYK624_166840 [Phanerochaete sordida]|uniref:Uncharacterized protein n=1 Tax=Phanerochaete sordida TaxID=48140 RepID=A0A9P3GX38_9APHY|nr:hypothetical protein PsYK624_166840 [Phanerochaete sordida]